MDVRRGRPEDLPEVLRLLSRVWDDDYVSHLWLEWAQHPEQGIVLVAETDEEIVGTSYVRFIAGGDCWLQALRVHPGVRRLGIGSALTSASLSEARSASRQHAYLGIDADNTASLSLTARAGFRQIASYARFVRALSGPANACECLPAPWREAAETDLDAMQMLARTVGRRDLISGWQWQPLSEETLRDNVNRHTLWLWSHRPLTVFAGYEVFEGHHHLFDPCGTEDAVRGLITELSEALSSLSGSFEVWLRQESPLLGFMQDSLGFAQEEAYTIWQYPLQPIQ